MQDIDASKDDNAEVGKLHTMSPSHENLHGQVAAAAALRGSSSYGLVAEKCGTHESKTTLHAAAVTNIRR